MGLILDRYIVRHVLAGVLVVFIGLVSLFFIGDLLSELDTVGRGDFGYAAALAFVLMRTPSRMYALLPAATLIGGLLGLGALARGSELTAMRAAGAPVSRILGAAMRAGALVIALGLLVGEWLAPAAERLAHDWRTAALTGQTGGRAEDGFWIRDDRRFLHFGEALPDGRLRDVRGFEFDAAGSLSSAWIARRASPLGGPEGRAGPAAGGGGREAFWRLEEVRISRFSGGGRVETRQAASILRRLPAGADQAGRLTARPGWLSLPGIVSYIRRLRDNGLRTAHYDAALWSRLMAPFSTAAMLFTAVALVLGPLRHASFGPRIVAGAAFGIGFHIVQKVVTQMGVVYDWFAPLAAAAPVAALGLLGWWWLRRAAV